MSTQTATRTLVEVNPADLIIGANVRLDARVDAELVESIRARGVICPIVAYRDDRDALVVLAGQRRTLASIEAEQDSVPVVVVARPAETDRLGDQIVENDARAALSEAERVTAYDQMALLGMSAAQIAKATGARRERVAAALTVAKSSTAHEALEGDNPLTLDEAAILAEFDGDEDAITKLMDARRWRGMEHAAQRIRDDRRRAALVREHVKDLTAQGVTAVDLTSGTTAATVASLYDQDGQRLDPEAHTGCPGHAQGARLAYVGVYVDATTGEVADDQEAAEEAVEAYYAADTEDEDTPPYREETCEQVQTVAVCLDPEAHGHRRAPHLPVNRTASTTTDAEDEARRAERRRVIENNKAWASAETVRRAWLGAFVAGKSAPKGAAKALGTLLLGHARTITEHRHSEYARTLLGTDLAATIDKASDTRALRLTLLLALAACEDATNRDDWRNTHTTTGTYLNLLAGWGYPLSEVERLAAGLPPTPTDQDDQDDAPDQG